MCDKYITYFFFILYFSKIFLFTVHDATYTKIIKLLYILIMISIIYKILLIFIFGMSSNVNGKINQYCRLENRTIIFNICKNPPQFILPVCIGFCSSMTQWDFYSNKFIARTNTCKVTKHRTESFVCPDSTHTAIELMIPLACSCTKHHCYS